MGHKHNEKKKHSTSKKGSLMESTELMFQQLVRRARKSFSKVVIVLINDQGDDTGDDDDDDDEEEDSDLKDAQDEEKQEEDRNNSNHGIKKKKTEKEVDDNDGDDDDDEEEDSDLNDAQDEEKQEEDRNNSNRGIKKKKTEKEVDDNDGDDDDYIDDDSVKEEARTTHQNENASNDGDSGGDASECAQKDWKCWRNKYTSEKTETATVDNAKNDVQDKKSDDDHGGEKKAVANTIELEGKAHPTSSEVLDDASSNYRHSSSQVERGVSRKSKKSDLRNSKIKKRHSAQAQLRKSTKSDKDKSKKLKKWDEKKSSDGEAYCKDGNYSKRTLKLAYEMPFQALFRDTEGQQKFEASSVIVVDSMAYAICDSSWSISMFDPYLHPFGEHNRQIGDPNREVEDSGYEALFYDDQTFFVVRESVETGDETYHAVIEELLLDPEISEGSYEFGRACPTEFKFEGDSKGFEGAIPIHDLNGDLTILGLCEGNHCSQSKELQRDKGNGRLVAMKLVTLPDGSCEWSTIRVLNIPETAYFGDYSSIDMDLSGRVMISSQEESQLWIGQLDGIQPNGLWNVTGIEFRQDEHTIFDFPKNDNCETIYCNIEGVHWVDEYTIIAVSDKMKSKGTYEQERFVR
ncbi:MAG: hypothetical protein SGILL_003334 [Bacillariaceae sp.]